MIKTVTLLSNPKKNVSPQAAGEIIGVLKEAGVGEIRTDENIRLSPEISNEVIITDGEGLFEGSDFIVVMGGDGSILAAARKSAAYSIPIAGINFGRLGYLCELEYSEKELLGEMIKNGFRTEERMMLDVSIDGREDIKLLPCLNDVVLSNGPISRISFFDLWCNSTEVTRYSADGIIICTPTGSSAYSLSAGGPLIYQTMDCICATPICPHSMTMRPIVFDPDAVIQIRNPYCRQNRMFITVDGRDNVEVFPGDTVTVRKSTLTTKLARIKNQSFVDVLHEKLADVGLQDR